MGIAHDRRGAFTLMELMVVVTIAAILLAVLIPAIRESRETSNRTQCSNNLKQIGIGLLNFHDVRKEICPAYLTNDHGPQAAPRDYVTWPRVVLPYVEQTNDYELIDLCEPLSGDVVGPLVPYGMDRPALLRHEPDHPTARKIPISTYYCPARRTHHLTVNGVASVGDYANVSRADLTPLDPAAPRTWDAAMLPSRYFNTSRQVVVIDGVELGEGDFRSMTTFADITDGLSHTAFIGEKAVRSKAFGGHRADFSKTIDPDQQDGTFFYGGLGVKNNLADLQAPGAIAYWSRRLAPLGTSPTLPPNARTDNPENRFGGWHGSKTFFLLGDGSIREVSHATSNRVLQQLGCRNDQPITSAPDAEAI